MEIIIAVMIVLQLTFMLFMILQKRDITVNIKYPEVQQDLFTVQDPYDEKGELRNPTEEESTLDDMLKEIHSLMSEDDVK